MQYKTIQKSVDYLNQRGIQVTTDEQIAKLSLIGGIHGIEKYYYYRNDSRKLPFNNIDEIYATILYDRKLKSLLYEPIMLVETVMKNILLDCICSRYQISFLFDLYEVAIKDQNTLPKGTTPEAIKVAENKKAKLISHIQSAIDTEVHSNNKSIVKIFNQYGYNFPIDIFLETISFGVFSSLLECLTDDFRNYIAKQIGYNDKMDTTHITIYSYPRLLKNLRNKIAHNNVIYDARFNEIIQNKATNMTVLLNTKLPSINYKNISDYLFTIVFILKFAEVSKHELIEILDNFLDITRSYKSAVNQNISNITIQKDIESRIEIMKSFVKY